MTSNELGAQTAKMVQAVQNAVLMKYIERTCPLMECVTSGDMVELEGCLRQFVMPGTPQQIRLSLSGRATPWADIDRRALIGIFQIAIAGTNTKGKVKPTRSCLSCFCGCVSCMVWTPILLLNLCLILGFVGFVVMDERGQDPEFWKGLVTPSVCPAEDRLTDFTKANLVEVKTQLEHANNKKLTEILVVVNEAAQKVEPRVQFLEHTVEEAETLVETFMETLSDAKKQQADIGNNLTVLGKNVADLTEDVQVLRNKTDMQTKEVNAREATMKDLISSLDEAKTRLVSFIVDSENHMDRVWNATLERLRDLEGNVTEQLENVTKNVTEQLENVTEQLQVTKTEISQLKAGITLTMDDIRGKLVEAKISMDQLMERLNNAHRDLFPDGGPLFMFYLWVTSLSVYIFPVMYVSQKFLSWSTKLFTKGTKTYSRLNICSVIVDYGTVCMWYNLYLCFFIVLGAKLIAVVELIQNNPWVQLCVDVYKGVAWLFGKA